MNYEVMGFELSHVIFYVQDLSPYPRTDREPGGEDGGRKNN